ncbi:MAG: hypothetical protein AAF571_13780 [Verrucomicrobiota bacterium]
MKILLIPFVIFIFAIGILLADSTSHSEKLVELTGFGLITPEEEDREVDSQIQNETDSELSFIKVRKLKFPVRK